MVSLSSKPDEFLRTLLVDTLAYSSLLRNTGMRSITGIFLEKEAFTETDDYDAQKRRTGIDRNIFSFKLSIALPFNKTI